MRKQTEQKLDDAIKRLTDIAGATGGLLALSPLIGAAALAVGVSMGRPVFFRQQRPGRSGRPFELIKFRTMREARPDEQGPEFDEVRLTRIGRLLRSTSIDELPTLINVLRGQMSLVGPRPLLIRYNERYNKRQARRLEVKPGITGWAQINGRNAISWPEKFELDVYYVENRSTALDLQILVKTVLKVLAREGISQDGCATMPEFMGNDSDQGKRKKRSRK